MYTFEDDTHFFFPMRNYSFNDEACRLETLTELGMNNLYSSMLNA